MTHSLNKTSAAIGAAATSLMLAACGGDSSKVSTQVAAKVNKDEISVHQVNQQLARVNARGMTPEQQKAVKKQIVDGLVDQQLLIAQALEAKLDRDPEVLARLENARREVLAQAYVQKSLAASAKPAPEEVKKYYDEHPALFSERKAYRLQELVTNVPPEKVELVRGQAQKSKSMTELSEWLKGGGYQFAANAAVRQAEQLPMVALPQIAAMKEGEIGTFANEKGVTVLRVMGTQPQPLDPQAASPVIEQYLGNIKRDQLLATELKRLRSEAKIEYLGDLAGSAAATAATAHSPATAASDAPSTQPQSMTAPAPSVEASKADDKSISKGISGLR